MRWVTRPAPVTVSSEHPRRRHQAACGSRGLTPRRQIPSRPSCRAASPGGAVSRGEQRPQGEQCHGGSSTGQVGAPHTPAPPRDPGRAAALVEHQGGHPGSARGRSRGPQSPAGRSLPSREAESHQLRRPGPASLRLGWSQRPSDAGGENTENCQGLPIAGATPEPDTALPHRGHFVSSSGPRDSRRRCPRRREGTSPGGTRRGVRFPLCRPPSGGAAPRGAAPAGREIADHVAVSAGTAPVPWEEP